MTIFSDYFDLISQTASDETNNFLCFIERLHYLKDHNKLDIQRLLTSAIGITSEMGELLDSFNNIILNPKDEYIDNFDYYKCEIDGITTDFIKEMGDVIWYVSHALISLNITDIEFIKGEMEVDTFLDRENQIYENSTVYDEGNENLLKVFDIKYTNLQERADQWSGEQWKNYELVDTLMLTNSHAYSFSEIVKKIVFQNKKYNRDSFMMMKSNLCNILCNLSIACNLLGVSFEYIIDINSKKIKQRFPERVKNGS